MAKSKKKLTDVKITNTKKSPKEKLIDEATALGLKFQDNVTVKELKALIQTEKLKADLPAPPPPPPALSFKTLKNKDRIIKVGPGKGARILQGLAEVDGEDKWRNISIISPTGAPSVRLRADRKVDKKIRKVRLMQSSEKGEELETMKL